MTSRDRTGHNSSDLGSVESWLVSAGRDRRPGSPLNVPPCPASNFVLGDRRAYPRDDGTPSWESLEEIVGGLEGGSSVSLRVWDGGDCSHFRPTSHWLGCGSVGRLLSGCSGTRQSWPKPWRVDRAP